MKYVKMLGLAAVAITLMAFAAGTASATTVENGTPPYGHPITWDAKIEGGSARFESTSGSLLTTCAGGTLKFIETQTGSATTTTKWHFLSSGVTWSSCATATHTTAGGELEIHHIAGTVNGTLTGSGFEVTIETLGTSCTYGFGSGMVDFGTITGHSHTPVIHIGTVFTEQTGDKFICPNDVIWNAEYHIVDPIGLTVTAG